MCQSMLTESRPVAARGWEEGKMGSNCLIGMEFPFSVMNMSWNKIELIVVQCGECIKCQ